MPPCGGAVLLSSRGQHCWRTQRGAPSSARIGRPSRGRPGPTSGTSSGVMTDSSGSQRRGTRAGPGPSWTPPCSCRSWRDPRQPTWHRASEGQLADRTAHLPGKGVVRPGPGVTRAARTGRKGLASAIGLMSRTGCANSEPGASLGMPVQSAGAITPGPGATVPRWSGGGDTRAGGDQELAWDSVRGEGWWTCEGAGRSPRPRHLETF